MLFRSLWTGSFSEFFNFPILNLQRLPWLGFKVQNGKGKESWGCHHSSHGSFFSCLCTKYVLAQCMAVGKASRRRWCSQLLVFQMCRQMAAGSWSGGSKEQTSGARCAVTICVFLSSPQYLHAFLLSRTETICCSFLCLSQSQAHNQLPLIFLNE